MILRIFYFFNNFTYNFHLNLFHHFKHLIFEINSNDGGDSIKELILENSLFIISPLYKKKQKFEMIVSKSIESSKIF